jgi:hypothetical protein
MKRGKRENLMGKIPPPKRGKKNAEWPKVTYSVVSTTPSIALSSENFFLVKDLVKMSTTCCSMGQYYSEMTLSRDQLVDVMHVNLNVLGPLPLNWINRYLNGPLIVTKYDNRKWILNTKPREKPLTTKQHV